MRAFAKRGLLRQTRLSAVGAFVGCCGVDGWGNQCALDVILVKMISDWLCSSMPHEALNRLQLHCSQQRVGVPVIVINKRASLI